MSSLTTAVRELPKAYDALVEIYAPKPILDQGDYRRARDMLDALTRIPRYSPGQSRYLDMLGMVIVAYERKHHAIRRVRLTPLEMLRDFMEDFEMTVTDLAALLGCHKSTASLILSGKRGLTVAHIRKLADRFKVSTDLFIA